MRCVSKDEATVLAAHPSRRGFAAPQDEVCVFAMLS